MAVGLAFAPAGVTVGDPPPFAPDQVSGLVVWLKANDLAGSDGDSVVTWTDSSGNGHSPTQGTAGAQPLLKKAANGINGQNVVRFDGSDDCLTDAAFPDFGDTYTIFAVVRFDATGDLDQGVFEVGTGSVNSGFSLLSPIDTGKIYFRGRGASTVHDAIHSADERDDVARIQVGRNSGSAVSGWRNGSPYATTNVAYTAPNPSTLTQLDVGKVPFGAFLLKGDVAELLIYDTAISDGHANSIGDYLADEYALTWTAI